MSTLLLRLDGPLQAWGTSSRFRERDTGREPSKSGVIGLLCAALGKPRVERAGDGFPALLELAALLMGVRVEREGTVLRDYQTAGGGRFADEEYGTPRANGNGLTTVLSNRYYLSDACFLVGLEGARSLLERLQQALERPVWQLCLGRKAFPPAAPVWLPDGLREEPLLDALQSYPRLRRSARGQQGVRLVIQPEALPREQANGASVGAPVLDAVRQDVPLSFNPAARRFTIRRVVTTTLELPEG